MVVLLHNDMLSTIDIGSFISTYLYTIAISKCNDRFLFGIVTQTKHLNETRTNNIVRVYRFFDIDSPFKT